MPIYTSSLSKQYIETNKSNNLLPAPFHLCFPIAGVDGPKVHDTLAGFWYQQTGSVCHYAQHASRV